MGELSLLCFFWGGENKAVIWALQNVLKQLLNFDFVVVGIINLYSITASKTTLYLILTVVGSNINLV